MQYYGAEELGALDEAGDPGTQEWVERGGAVRRHVLGTKARRLCREFEHERQEGLAELASGAAGVEALAHALGGLAV